MLEKLNDATRVKALSALPEWRYDADRKAIHRELQLENFAEAFGLMTRIAIEAEKLDHHPEWSNVYNRVDIWLTTHDADGVSDRDIFLAQRIDYMVV